ncbi:oxidoreductase [Castellaniella sp.]|uniref:oxidoreductase n=1 Tax=Castellaniella sp. TaxID=1955812 RepID=UPI00356B10C1
MSSDHSSATPVWFISGCSTGFGRELASQALARGWRVVATARQPGSLSDLVASHADRALAQPLDVTRHDQIDAAVAATLRQFGRIDVLVNNAGYGYQSSIEEGDDAEIRAMFDANVFGLFALTRAILPIMRQQRSGHVFNITSLAGLRGFAGSGYYAATKHAIEGWADALAQECNPLGIQVTNIEPGPFRTDWAGRSLHQTPAVVEDYAETAGARMQSIKDASGKQAGDPARAAKLMLELSLEQNAPLNIALGAAAIRLGTERLQAKIDSIQANEARGLATDFPHAGR